MSGRAPVCQSAAERLLPLFPAMEIGHNALAYAKQSANLFLRYFSLGRHSLDKHNISLAELAVVVALAMGKRSARDVPPYVFLASDPLEIIKAIILRVTVQMVAFAAIRPTAQEVVENDMVDVEFVISTSCSQANRAVIVGNTVHQRLKNTLLSILEALHLPEIRHKVIRVVSDGFPNFHPVLIPHGCA